MISDLNKLIELIANHSKIDFHNITVSSNEVLMILI